MNLLARFRRHEVLGMDAGEGCVKLVQLQRGASGETKFRRKLCFDRPLQDSDQSLALFRAFLKKEGLEGWDVACNIEHPSLKIRKVDLPVMESRDLQDAVHWKMRDVVEGPIENFIVRFSRLEEYSLGENKRLSLLAYAVERAAVLERERLLTRLGLKPVLIEPTSVSLTTAFADHHPEKRGKVFALLDVGKAKTLLILIGSERLLFSRPLPGFSIASLTKEEVEGVPEDHAQMAVEIQRSLDAFALIFGQQSIECLFLSGGGARLPELPRQLSTNLGIKTIVMNPLERWNLQEDEAPLFTTAVGLALYGYGEN